MPHRIHYFSRLYYVYTHRFLFSFSFLGLHSLLSALFSVCCAWASCHHRISYMCVYINMCRCDRTITKKLANLNVLIRNNWIYRQWLLKCQTLSESDAYANMCAVNPYVLRVLWLYITGRILKNRFELHYIIHDCSHTYAFTHLFCCCCGFFGTFFRCLLS